MCLSITSKKEGDNQLKRNYYKTEYLNYLETVYHVTQVGSIKNKIFVAVTLRETFTKLHLILTQIQIMLVCEFIFLDSLRANLEPSLNKDNTSRGNNSYS